MEQNESTAAAGEEEVVLVGHEERTGARADFISSLILILVGLCVMYEAVCMPLFEGLWPTYARPGFPPFTFGVFLVIASGIVFIRSIMHGGYRLGITSEGVSRLFRASSTRRFLYVLACVAVYFALMNYATIFPSRFLFSSIIFLFAMMLYFKAGSVTRCAIYSVLMALGSWALFEKIFLVPLP